MEEAGAGLSSRRLAEEAMVQSWAALVEAEADMGVTAGALAKIEAIAAAVGSLEIEEEEEDEEEERSLLIQQEAETVVFFATEAIVEKFFFFLIGLIVSLIGFCNNLTIENLTGTKFVVTSNMMLESMPILFLFLFSFDSVLFGWWKLYKFSREKIDNFERVETRQSGKGI